MQDKEPIFLIDSNILIYAYSEKDENKKRLALKLLEKCWNGEIKYAVSLQNLAEFFSIAYNKFNIELTKAESILSDIIEFKGFVKINYSEKTLIGSIGLIKKFSVPFWDSLIIETMKENGIFNIYTENTDDFKISLINAVNPFKGTIS